MQSSNGCFKQSADKECPLPSSPGEASDQSPALIPPLVGWGGVPSAEEASAHRSYRRLFDNNMDAVFALDRLGRFIEINPAAQRLCGYDQAELVGRCFSDLCIAEQLETANRFFSHAMVGDARNLELTIVRRDGRQRKLFVTGTPIMEGDAIWGVLCIARNITGRKRMERALREARHEAEQAVRAKDRFLSVVSHELRTPLTPVLTMVQVLQERTDLSPELREAMGMIRRNLELEARLIDDLLDLSRIRRGHLELMHDLTDVHARIRNVLRLCEADARLGKMEVELHLDATSHQLLADPGRVQQVIWNLLKNAIKYTPSGGRITVRTRNVTGSAEFPTTLVAWNQDAAGDWGIPPPIHDPNQRFILVEILDTGVGISADRLSGIFDNFERLDADSPLFDGVGLGLTISRALVELHGGRIWAHSDGLGQGAVFTVALPIREVEEPRKAAHRSPSTGHAPMSGRRILLVEDHPDTAKVMTYLLRSYGHTVTTVATVSAAIAASLDTTFDLLVSDIGLPDGTGLDVMTHLRQDSEIPGIALSGFGMEEDVARSRSAGFAEHLVKPINLKQFEAALRRLLGDVPED